MKKMRRILFLISILCYMAACGSEGLTPVKILAPDGSLRHEFQAELALTPPEQAQGLMYRQELGADRGMLFVFSQPTSTSFWMKNTLISLDMLFIGTDKKIVSIVERAAPQTTTPRSAEGPFQYVLEIEGGRAQALGIQAGDLTEFDYKK